MDGKIAKLDTNPELWLLETQLTFQKVSPQMPEHKAVTFCQDHPASPPHCTQNS